MHNSIFRKYFAMLLVIIMMFVPVIQPYAEEPFFDVEMEGNVIDTDTIGSFKNSDSDKQVITLITGDVVTITAIEGGKSVITVEPAVNASGGVQIMTLGKETFVIPNEAMPYIASDFLDKDLFNITMLMADGYDDGNQSTLPVIVQYNNTGATFETAQQAILAGSEQMLVLESIGAVALSTQKEQAKMFWDDITAYAETDDSIKKVWLDGRVEANLAQSVPMIGAPEAWAQEYDGTGVTVAVLDSGLDTEHPDLAGQFDDVVSFVPHEQEGTDYNGHGTHVSSTVLGTGAASNGTNKGVAPGARLISGKVLAKDGFGQESWVIAGMNWAAENAKIVNMSLGDPRPSDGQDLLSVALNEISERTGALFVVSAGNTGTEGIGSPGAADAALTVGSVTKSDSLSGFSSRGPRFMEDGLKPDLLAPGSGIVAARSQFAQQGSGPYLSLNGTSMAAPHVAGAAAILAQRYPDWTGEELKHALMSTTKKIDRIKPYYGGTGRLDVAASTLGKVYATGSLDFGFFDWPHENDGVVVKTVTYRNESAEPVVLDLSATFTNNANKPAPDGLLSVSDDQITVPANETAVVTVTVDPNLAELGNRYQGHLTASVNGEKVAHTAMVMNKESEKYSLKINVIDENGEEGRTIITLVGSDFYPEIMEVQGSKELRLPPGTYSVMTMMDINKGTDNEGVAVLGNPEIILDGHKTVELDARNVNEITANVKDKTEANFRKLEYYRSFGGEYTTGETFIIPRTVNNLYAQSTEVVTEGEFRLNTRWRLVKPILGIDIDGVDLESIPLAGSTPLEGKHQLKVVYAENGTPNDYRGLDVKDKAVLIKRSNSISGSERAAAASKAGAKLLIIMNTEDSKFTEWVGKADNKTQNPIAVVSVSGSVGEGLLNDVLSGNVTLNVDGSADSPYLYDLIDDHKNVIPEDLSYSPIQEELVKIDAQYYSDRSEVGMEWRVDIPSYSTAGAGDFLPLTIPSNRTEWVTASEGTNWVQMAIMLDRWEVRGELEYYEPGEQLVEKWFAPIARPRFGDGYWASERFGNNASFNVPAWADSGKGHTGTDESGNSQQTLTLYQGETELLKTKGQSLRLKLSEENTQYRLVNEASRDSERWNTSVSTHTEWTFWTKEEDSFYYHLPLMSLDYEVETDMKGNAKADDTIKLGLSVSQIEYAIGNGEIEGASLQISFDEGLSWDDVELVREGDGWIAEISNAGTIGTYVSLRASAWDDLGNRIDQDIINAFGISDSTYELSTDKADYSITTGSTQQMKVTEVATPKEDGEAIVTDVTNRARYTVEDEKVASVKNGLITAKTEGSTQVTVSYGGNELTVNVTVTDPDSDFIVTLSTDKAEYAVTTGSTQQMTVTEVTTPKGEGEPTTADVTKEASYKVEDEKVASVKEGLITAKAEGSTQVTVSYGGNELTVNVTVTDSDSDFIVTLSTDKAEYALTTGSTQHMKVTEVTTPKGDGEPTSVDVTKEATYVAEDEKVATVKDGLITAKANGSTKVVVSYAGQEVTVNVTVADPVIPGPGPNPDPGPVDPKPEAPVFSDIANTFAENEINKLAAKGIIQGKTETTFAPNAQITRAEFTVLLARALDLPMKEYKGKFKDVNTSKKWAYAGIEAAATAGIVNGSLDGKFNPDAPIKREEIAAMVVRAIEYKDKAKLDNLETPANFKDHGSIGAYAIDSVYKATALGVIKGNDGQFKPKNNATRAEAAVMLYRALDTLKLMD